jgi:hypothetical protein
MIPACVQHFRAVVGLSSAVVVAISGSTAHRYLNEFVGSSVFVDRQTARLLILAGCVVFSTVALWPGSAVTWADGSSEVVQSKPWAQGLARVSSQ